MNIPYRVPLLVSTDDVAVNLGVQEPKSVDLDMTVGVYAQIGEHYQGSYYITPDFDVQTLRTSGLIMDDDVTFGAMERVTFRHINPSAHINMEVDDHGGVVAYYDISENVYPVYQSGYADENDSIYAYNSGAERIQLDTQPATTVTPTESAQTAVASGKYTTGVVDVAAIPSSYVGSAVERKEATTYNPQSTDRTIPAGTYLTGAQTIKGAPLQNKTATVNGSVTADNGYYGLGTVTVNVSGLDFPVTLSYDSNDDMWKPDATYSEIADAYDDHKTILFVADDNNAAAGGYYDTFMHHVSYCVRYVIIDAQGNDAIREDYYTLNQNGLGLSDRFDYSVIYNEDTTVTPTESQQTITADADHTGLGTVTVNAIPSNYVGTGITRRSSSDLIVYGREVTAPSGYYASDVTGAIPYGTEGSPTATKGTVSNHSISVTPQVTNTEGYIEGGQMSGTPVTVSASELVSGTYTVSSSGTQDVTNYASISVASGTAGTPTATKGAVSNHSVSVTPSVTNTTGYITGSTKTGTAVTVSASELVSGSETKTANGTYDVTNLAELVVNVSGGGGSEWTHIATAEMTVNTTSTSAASAGTISCGSTIADKDSIIYVRIRDKEGKRAGYFAGSDAYFMNYNKANGSTSAFAVPAVLCYRYTTSSAWAGTAGQYGVYGYSISNTGVLTVRRRYNSNYSLTINSTYTVDVFKLTYPTGYPAVFDM